MWFPAQCGRWWEAVTIQRNPRIWTLALPTGDAACLQVDPASVSLWKPPLAEDSSLTQGFSAPGKHPIIRASEKGHPSLRCFPIAKSSFLDSITSVVPNILPSKPFAHRHAAWRSLPIVANSSSFKGTIRTYFQKKKILKQSHYTNISVIGVRK